MKKLYIFGDSIAFGQHISIHKTWAAMLSKYLEDKFICQNPSINRNTTKDALNRIAFDIEQHMPEVVYIQFGLNDANFWVTDKGMPRVSKSLYEANLKEIILRLFNIAKTEKILLATNHLPTKQIDFKKKDEYIINVKEYNKIVRKVAMEFVKLEMDVILIDHEKNSLSFDNFLLEDGVHLNENGHKIYFEFIKKVLAKGVL